MAQNSQPWVAVGKTKWMEEQGLDKPEVARVTLESLYNADNRGDAVVVDSFDSASWVEVPTEHPDLKDTKEPSQTYLPPKAASFEDRRAISSLLTKYGSRLESMEGMAAPLSRDMVWKLMRGASTREKPHHFRR